jgi:hypothetical protein
MTCPKCGGRDPTGRLRRAWFTSWHGVWVGALVGAVVGCLSRPAVVAAFWLSGHHLPEENVLVVVVISCLIGGLVGAFAGAVGGCIRVPIVGGAVGAAVGGCLALCAAFVTAIPLCIATYNPHDAAPHGGLWYLPLITLTGVVSGALGGLAGVLLRGKRVDATSEGQKEVGDPSEPSDKPAP